ncbi:hypothetical protein GCM10011321_28340 [Youhaiella tibetensis]|uniref:Uncharacterized protein n=1 Tax=Paradevosia tibetensis TaxID=1447062 RepID=A0A5B9DJZ4_9HYPH|nr:hypothetical protein [Youhaiella tibetensis]QEE19172.1 hypothetical protein FNA67_02835 [Youhaiella tibetensis]GGF35594.1 hypothetical protein GCM10011321_28340 [Youhaiella tibetensis]
MAAKNTTVTEGELALRENIFPGADKRLWEKTRDQGFITIPKTMPYIVMMLNEMSEKGKPLGDIYQILWTYTWNNNGFIRLGNMRDLAFVAGFKGERGERTLRERLRSLEVLGFIELKPHGNNPTGFAFIPNPHPVILALHKAHAEADSAKKAKLPPLREETFMAFLVRATDIKAVDVARVLKEQNEPPKGAAEAPAKTKVTFKIKPKPVKKAAA